MLNFPVPEGMLHLQIVQTAGNLFASSVSHFNRVNRNKARRPFYVVGSQCSNVFGHTMFDYVTVPK